MKQTFIVVLFLSTNLLQAQSSRSTDRQQIEGIMQQFMECIVKKDSTRFMNLFYKGPVQWIGSIKPASYVRDLAKNKASKEFFHSTPQQFISSIMDDDNCEEKFYHVQIMQDGNIATASFDYSFWKNGKKENWGQESWALIKVAGEWKITGVIFSIEMEEVAAEPSRR